MTVIKEFRIPLPMTVDEYQIGQLYTVADMSKSETQGDAGIQILVNEPYNDPELGQGQYTHKVIHLGSRVPRWVSLLCPSSALKLDEKAWNSYPYCKTVYSNPFLGDRFSISVETWHKEHDIDIPNVHELDANTLRYRQVEYIDIITDPSEPKDYSKETDPKLCRSEATGRGPLQKGWMENAKPRMCCYKLVTVKFAIWGFQTKVESFIASAQTGLFLKFHRLLFCLLDQWIHLNMADIRRIEAEAKDHLNELIAKNNLEGSIAFTSESTSSVLMSTTTMDESTTTSSFATTTSDDILTSSSIATGSSLVSFTELNNGSPSSNSF